MTARWIAGVVGIVVVNACVGGERAPDPAEFEAASSPVRTYDSAGVVITENRQVGTGDTSLSWNVSAAASVDFSREMGPEYESAVISTVFWVSPHRFVVVDPIARRMRSYDETGSFLAEAGRPGEGPGEFRDMMFVSRYNSDSIIVYDSALNRLSVFDHSLTFARVQRVDHPDGTLWWRPVAVVPGGGILFVAMRIDEMPRMRPGINETHFWLYSHDPVEEVNEPVMPLPPERSFMFEGEPGVPVLFGTLSVQFPTESGYGSAWTGEYSFRLYNRDHRLERIIRANTPPRTVTSSMANSAREEADAGVPDIPPAAYIRRAYAEMPVPSTLPRFGSSVSESQSPMVLADDLGRLWVLEYEYLRSTPQTWSIYDENGRFRGRVRFAPSFSLRGVEGNSAIGLWRDEDGVEHVRVYEVNASLNGSRE